MITLIAAVSLNGCIGVQNSLPWKLVGELKFFKEMTEGHTVVMGRKTYESIGCKPLPNRVNVVLTNNQMYDNCSTYSMEQLNQLKHDLMIIGGQQIYQQFIDKADRLIITEVGLHVEGDAFFPIISNSQWKEESRRDTQYFCKIHERNIDCSHVTYVRLRV